MASRASALLRDRGLAVARSLTDHTGMTPGRTMQRFASWGALLVTIAGLVLFAYTIQHAGVHETIERVKRMGVGGFLLILALSGIRLLVRSLAWVWCVEGTPRLSLAAAFDASLIGEALGNLTPFGTFISEPSKAILVRARVPMRAALSGIAVENIFYVLTLNVVIALGALTFLAYFPLSRALVYGSYAALAGVATCVGLALIVILSRATPLSTALTWALRPWRGHEWQQHAIARVTALETRIYSFYGRHRRKLLPLLLLEAIFHLAGVAEVFVTLSFILGGASVTLLDALILESVGRVINILFKFVPFRLGVDEGGAAIVSNVIGLGSAAGVTLALVRKARILCWTGVGVILLARRGLTIRTVINDAGAV
jgi:Lysylphosphatidylglycerol synthase TM region